MSEATRLNVLTTTDELSFSQMLKLAQLSPDGSGNLWDQQWQVFLDSHSKRAAPFITANSSSLYLVDSSSSVSSA